MRIPRRRRLTPPLLIAGSETSVLRAIVIGCGQIAGGYNRGPGDRLVLTHALAYRRHSAYELVACVDPNARVRNEFAARWAVPAAFASLDEAIAAGNYDVASVCSPTGTQ